MKYIVQTESDWSRTRYVKSDKSHNISYKVMASNKRLLPPKKK